MSNKKILSVRLDIPLELLKSKRLLSDHVELLEDAFNCVELKPTNMKLAIGLLVPSTALVAANIVGLAKSATKTAAIVFGGGLVLSSSFFAYSGLNAANYLKTVKQVNLWKDLISKVSEYNNKLRASINYLTDMSVLNVCDETSSLSIDSVKKVIETLHKIVIDLDNNQNITDLVPNYEPFEDLNGYDMFQCSAVVDLKKFKEIYKIFVYIQSQFLLRVCIDLLLNENDQKKWDNVAFIRDLMSREIESVSLKNTKKNSSQFLDLPKPCPGDDLLRKLKSNSMTLSSKLLAQNNYFENLQERVQKLDNLEEKNSIKFIIELNESLKNMESMLVTTNLEFESLSVLVRKILNIRATPKLDPLDAVLEVESVKVLSQNSQPDIDDEFFILDGEHQEEKEDFLDIDDLTNVKLMKSTFKPVLKQLRTKIDPLNAEMLAREQKCLKEKGITLNDVIQETVTMSSSCSTETEDELDDNFVLRKKKPGPRPSKYDEHRDFLVQKDQIRLPTMKPCNMINVEDILE